MEELRDLASDGLIADFIENPPRILSTENVSGVSLHIDDFWLRWSRVTRWPPYPYHSGIPTWRDMRTYFGARHDFIQKPPNWGDYCNRKGYPRDAHPVTVIVILRDPYDPKRFPDVPRSIDKHPIIYEHRPEAVGYLLTPGDFLACAGEGTLGGFLWNTNDSTYQAMSCAHVLGAAVARAYSPEPGIFTSKSEIGSVTFWDMPSASTGKCNRKIQPYAPVVDLALVTVDSATATSISVPGLGRVTADTAIANMDQDDPVDFVGYKSGHVKAKTAEFNIWKELKINGVATCYSDLFVIDHVNYPYIATSLAKPGDSGAWIASTSGAAVWWDGMLIGGDGIRAYCCFAENIMAKLAGEPLILP